MLGAAAAAAVTCVSPVAAARPACAPPVEAVRLRLPAPLRLITACATYTVSRTGRVHEAATRPIRGGVTWMAVAGDGAPVVQTGSHIAVLAHDRTVFQSRGRFRAAGVFATVGPGAVAFGYERFSKTGEQTELYLAPLGGDERLLAQDEHPLGWTSRGNLLTWRYRRGVYLRSRSGRLLRRIVGPTRQVVYDAATRTLLVIASSGLLERYRSGHWGRLASLAGLGLDRHTTFELLAGGLIGLLDGRRVIILRRDGSLFASARFPSGEVAGESGLVANPTGTVVAFVVTHGNPAAPHGRQSVQLLHAGDRQASTLYSGSVPGALCVRWATLAWHDSWLLYSVTGGRTLVLDTTRHARPLDLSTLVERLVPHGNLRSIGWA